MAGAKGGERIVKGADLEHACLAMTGASVDYPFDSGVAAFRVGGKIFALSRLDGDPLQVSLKCAPEIAIRLRAEHTAINPGYHLNKQHWNTVTLDGSVPEKLLRDMIEDSYDLVAESLTRAVRAEAGLPEKPRARRKSGGARKSDVVWERLPES